MPAKSKHPKYGYIECHECGKSVGIKPSVAKEFTKGNVGSKRFSKLKERIKRAKDNSK